MKRLERMDDKLRELECERHYLAVGMALLTEQTRYAETHNELLLMRQVWFSACMQIWKSLQTPQCTSSCTLAVLLSLRSVPRIEPQHGSAVECCLPSAVLLINELLRVQLR